MSKNQKIIIAVIVAALVIIAGIFVYQNAQAKAELEKVKQSAAQTITEVSLDDYEKADRETVSALKENYTEQLEKAESVKDVDSVMDTFWKELKQTETKAQKLEKAQNDAAKKINNFDTKGYNQDGIKEIEELQEKYVKQVNAATTKKTVKKVLQKFNEAVKAVKTEAEIKEEAAASAAAEQAAKEQNNKPAVSATKANAQKYVGSSVSALIGAIGSPNSRSYAQSCLGPGKDGVLRYNGFTVYTYKEGGKETVQSVE